MYSYGEKKSYSIENNPSWKKNHKGLAEGKKVGGGPKYL